MADKTGTVREEIDMRVSRSKTGLPTLTEHGGGSTNTGSATVVAGPNGEPMKPLFVPRGYANGEHAIFVLRFGVVIVDAGHTRGGELASVQRVVAIGTQNDPDEIVLESVGEYEDGDGNVPPQFNEAVKVALEKSRCYHCREPHYISK